jgi:hypothetical protein
MKRVKRQDSVKSKNIKTYKKLGKSVPKDCSSRSKDKNDRSGIKLNTLKAVNKSLTTATHRVIQRSH